MALIRVSCRLVLVLLAMTISTAAPAAFNDTRGANWRAQCSAGQSKYSCCKTAEQSCRDDCGTLEQCKRDCSSSYSACTRGMVAPQGGVVAPGLSGGRAVLDPGSTGDSNGKGSQKAPGGRILSPN